MFKYSHYNSFLVAQLIGELTISSLFHDFLVKTIQYRGWKLKWQFMGHLKLF